MSEEMIREEFEVFDDDFKRIFLKTFQEDDKFRNDFMRLLFGEFVENYKVTYANSIAYSSPGYGFVSSDGKTYEVKYQLRHKENEID